MERMLETLSISIPKGRTLRMRNAQGLALRAVEGTLWITEERDPADYALEAGDGRHVKSCGLTFVYAFEATRVELEAPAGAPMPAFEIGGGYNDYAAAVWKTQVWTALRRAWHAAARLARHASLANARP
jgi:hypothetical protein